MPHMMIFGLGYTSTRLAARLRAIGWRVSGTRRVADGEATAFDDRKTVLDLIADATHILSSVPPDGNRDPVLKNYGAALAQAPALWTGYLSSTGVYGDTDGAWVDESAPIGGGRRNARAEADMTWQALRKDVRIFRLPGIYGPARSVLDRLRSGKAHRIEMRDQVFSRVHVDDIVSGILAGLHGPSGVYNLTDDLPASQNEVIEHGCSLLNIAPPPLMTLEQAALLPPARAFYSENRRVANGKAKRVLQWKPQYQSYKQGLASLIRE